MYVHEYTHIRVAMCSLHRAKRSPPEPGAHHPEPGAHLPEPGALHKTPQSHWAHPSRNGPGLDTIGSSFYTASLKSKQPQRDEGDAVEEAEIRHPSHSPPSTSHVLDPFEPSARPLEPRAHPPTHVLTSIVPWTRDR